MFPSSIVGESAGIRNMLATPLRAEQWKSTKNYSVNFVISIKKNTSTHIFV